MEEQLPSVFIGSSTEGIDVAREIELQLQHDALTTIWKDGVFGLNQGTLESLMNALEQFDFGIMVLSPDDLLESRNERFASPRDNVVFELGLFMGRLGRSRTFIVHEKEANLKLPSDLAGIAISPYRKRDNLSAALSPTCTPIIKAIRSLRSFEGRATAQFSRATDQMKKTNEQVDQLSVLMAESRLLELEIVFSGFPGRISDEQRNRMGAQIQELRRLVERKPA